MTTPLELTLTLPPPQYARKGGEVVAAKLAKVGMVAKIENVEWAQWLSGTFKGNFDLTIINHVEPLDYMQYANTVVLLGLRQQGVPRAGGQACGKRRQPEGARQTVRRSAEHAGQRCGQRASSSMRRRPAISKKGLKGLWANSPIFVNDMSAVSWQ